MEKLDDQDPFYILLIMTAKEFEIAKVSVRMKHPVLGEFVVGHKGIPIREMKALMDAPGTTIELIQQLLNKFPGSVITGYPKREKVDKGVE